MKHSELICWLTLNCPVFTSLLNASAKEKLPNGIENYLSGGSRDEIEVGKTNFLSIEQLLSEIITYSSINEIGDTYRRDLSKVPNEKVLSEIFCEIALCAKVGSYSKSIALRPPTGKGTHSDCMFCINNVKIYGEVKRYQDSWPYIAASAANLDDNKPYGRSIFKSYADKIPSGMARPRHMDIQSKLEDVHRQFPDGEVNLLFVFLPSLGEPREYLIQALFGQNNFKKNVDDLRLEEDGLFTKQEWSIISGCCLTRVNPDTKAAFPSILSNLNSDMQLSDEMLKKLKSA